MIASNDAFATPHAADPAPFGDSAGSGRIASLDGLRGIAILLVMFLHFTAYGGGMPAGGVDRAVHRVALAGWIGVDLFFVLSGFLITGILLDTRTRPHYYRSFFTRRVLRIFPVYYASLFLLLVVLPRIAASPGVAADARDSVWYWTYLSNVTFAIDGWPEFGFIGHFWTLAVEEQFYLMWPFLVLALGTPRLKKLCLLLLGGALLLRVVLHAVGAGVAAYVLTPARVDTLAAGALVAIIVREPRGLERARPLARLLCGVAALAIGFLFVTRNALASEDSVVGTIGYSVIALFFASLLVLVLAAGERHRGWRMLRTRPLMAFGRYSYAIYIFHHPILFFLPAGWSIDALATRLGTRLAAHLLFVIAMTAMSLMAAVLSWHVLEKHCLRLKNTLAPGSPPAVPTHDASANAVA